MTRMCKTVSQRLGVEMLARAALLSLAREKVQRSSRKKLSPRQTCKNETILASLGIMGASLKIPGIITVSIVLRGLRFFNRAETLAERC